MIPWGMLSPEARATLRLVATPLSDGYSPMEIGRALGISTGCVEDALDDLRLELIELATRSRVLERLDALQHLQ
jgi:DNA-directed RNA polymerase specialized sigma24 family protein